MEHDDIPARDLLVRHHMIAQPGAAIAKFIHQQIIANQQRILHRFRRNLEGLHNESNHENRNHHGTHQRLQRTDQVRADRGYDAAVGRWQRGARRSGWDIGNTDSRRW